MTTTDKYNKIYDKNSSTWFEVSPDEFQEYNRRCTNLRKRMQYHGQCSCKRNKWWLCDGNCPDCKFYTKIEASLDETLPNGKGTLSDYVSDNTPTPEEIVSDRDLLNRLISRLREIDPEADRIIQIWIDHPESISDRKVAKILGRKQRTFADEMKKFRDEFKQYREK